MWISRKPRKKLNEKPICTKQSAIVTSLIPLSAVLIMAQFEAKESFGGRAASPLAAVLASERRATCQPSFVGSRRGDCAPYP